MSPKDLRITNTALELFYRYGYRKVSMSDIAHACRMSRPTLYASFENKEAIFTSLLELHRARKEIATAVLLPTANGLKAKLACLFDIWILEPITSVIGSPTGVDMMSNCSIYAAAALTDVYDCFEAHLVKVLTPTGHARRVLDARNIGYVLRTAIASMKLSADNLPQLQRMITGLIAMAVATARAPETDNR